MHLTVVTISFINFVNVTSYFLNEIDSNFNKIIFNSNKLFVEKMIVDSCKLHQKVCEFSRMINKYFTFLLLITYPLHFITFTSNIIYVGVCFINGDISFFIGVNLFWIIFCGYKTYLWIELSSRCMKSVSNINFKTFLPLA